MQRYNDLLDLAGRALVGLFFVYWGGLKLVETLGIGGRAEGGGGWGSYMEAFGVPGELLPLVILTELGGGLLLMIGWKTRYTALALAGFCLLVNLFFHMGWDRPPPAGHFNWVLFLKNLAVCGGLLAIAAHGAGGWSLDARRTKAAS